MKDLSEEELIKLYKDLYSSDSDMECEVNFDSLVRTYRVYLGLFFDEESSLFHNCKFLSYVVDGFCYFYHNIFGEENISSERIVSVLHEHDAELREKKQSDEEGRVEYTDDDLVLAYSLMIFRSFRDMKMLDIDNDKIQRVLFNCYAIQKQVRKDREKRMSSKVVYQKQFLSQSNINHSDN